MRNMGPYQWKGQYFFFLTLCLCKKAYVELVWQTVYLQLGPKNKSEPLTKWLKRVFVIFVLLYICIPCFPAIWIIINFFQPLKPVECSVKLKFCEKKNFRVQQRVLPCPMIYSKIVYSCFPCYSRYTRKQNYELITDNINELFPSFTKSLLSAFWSRKVIFMNSPCLHSFTFPSVRVA